MAWGILRQIGLALIGSLALGACSDVRLTQTDGMAVVRTGSLPGEEIHVRKIAGYFAPYALLAEAAYVDELYQRPPTRDAGPAQQRLATLNSMVGNLRAQFTDARMGRQVEERAWRWLDQWDLLAAYIQDPESDRPGRPVVFPCLAGPPTDGDGNRLSYVQARSPEECARLQPLDGLGVQIWARADQPCTEIVIAFRGTDADQSDDWMSNFRWLTRVLPTYDQYEQVQDHIHRLVAEARRLACPRGKVGRITAVGHSLGGGLAQQASYARPDITRVYAFDSSIVTGYYDRHIRDVRANSRELKTDRVFEHGEVLAYLRFVWRHVFPPSSCSPAHRSVRLNQVSGRNPVSQHSMALLTAHLISQGPAVPPRGVQRESALPTHPQADPQTGACLDPPQAADRSASQVRMASRSLPARP